MDWLFVIFNFIKKQKQIITHQLSFYPNSNALLHVERFTIICLLCHLSGMADENTYLEVVISDEVKTTCHNANSAPDCTGFHYSTPTGWRRHYDLYYDGQHRSWLS